MSDALGANSAAYVYDIKGRLTSENKTIDSTTYTTSYTYDGVDRPVTITYPTGEVVTHGYNGRGLPYTLTGSAALTLVTGATYNAMGMMKELKMGSATPLLKTTCNYYGTGGTNDTTGGYFGRLWEIKTVHSSTTLQDVKHTWDAAGNLTQRQFASGTAETEDFVYDYLDRLITTTCQTYSESFSYDTLGNITSKTTGGTTRNYTYGSSRPHAVTSISNPTTSYSYDNNGNMNVGTARTWDVENRLTSITKDSVTTTFVYDGDGSRVKQVVGGTTTVYVNQYYEKTGNDFITYYYLGSKPIARRTFVYSTSTYTLNYILQDHLGSTSNTASSTGVLVDTIRYFSFGGTRSGSVSTDIKFTGQRLDATGLYYYGARYYDAEIGRFISPDTIVPNFTNPQSLNRYSYCLNNPLRYIDPSGRDYEDYMRLYGGQVGEGGGGGDDDGGESVDATGISISVKPDSTFDQYASIEQVRDTGIFHGDCLISKDKFIFDYKSNKEIRMSCENLNNILAQGWTYEDIAFMVNQQPMPSIKVTGLSETQSSNPNITMSSGSASFAISICIFQPGKAREAADYILANGGKAYPGTHGGGEFLNDGRDGTTVINAQGPFREYDVPCEYGGRGLGRLAISNSGVWYTFDHYYNWIRLY